MRKADELTDLFIDLCESSCLQKLWIPKNGDRFYLKNNLYWEGYNLTSLPKNRFLLKPSYKSGIHYINNDFGITQTTSGVLKDVETLRRHSFWLPYQYQIQDMLLSEAGDLKTILYDFTNFCFRKDLGPIVKIYESFDESWLLFYHWIMKKELWNYEEKEFEKTDRFLWRD